MKSAANQFVLFLRAALLAFVFLAPAAAQAPSRSAADDSPAIWKIQGPKGKVYLFGSFHLLPENVRWRSAAVEQAFNEAEVFVYELDLEFVADQRKMQAVVARFGALPQGQTLKDVLPAPLYADLGRVCIDMGMPRQQFANYRPWLVAYVLMMQSFRDMGFDPARGVEAQSYAWAKARSKKFAALETPESQLRIFGDLSPEQENQYLQLTIGQIREAPQMLRAMLLAYRTGDTAAMQKFMNADLTEFPQLHTRIFKDRNASWVPQIEQMLQDGRTHVVIVGVGHLVGPDSVVAMLRAKNIAVEGPGAKAAAKP